MVHCRSRHRSVFLTGSPERWRFVAWQLLTNLVFVAALGQAIPVCLLSSPVVSSPTQDSLEDVDVQSLERWVLPSSGVARPCDAKSTRFEPCSGGVAAISLGVIAPEFLHGCSSGCDQGDELRGLATLVELNVRLQI